MALIEYLVSMAFAVFTAAAFVVAGIVLIKNSDMEINDTFGYRTPRSTKIRKHGGLPISTAEKYSSSAEVSVWR